MKTHAKEKDFWNEAIVFSSKDDNLTKGHIKYLESKLILMAVSNSEYKMDNAKLNEKSQLPEMLKADMEGFLENIKVVLPSLGYDILSHSSKIRKSSSKLFTLCVNGINAKGLLTTDGLIVLKDSIISKTVKEFLANGYVSRRSRLIEREKIKEIDGKLKFIEDIEFKNLSQAVAIIFGYSINGRKYWVNNKGLSIKDIEIIENPE